MTIPAISATPSATMVASEATSRWQRAEDATGAPPRQPVRPNASPPPLLSQPAPPGLNSDGFEEITFQASEREESEVHDELHDSHVLSAKRLAESLPVARVNAVLRLLEGDRSYHLLKQRAEIFARQFGEDRLGALNLLRPEAMDPTERFGLFFKAKECLERTAKDPEARATVEAMEQLVHADAEAIAHLMKLYRADAGDEGRVSAPNSPLLQYLSSPISPRMLVDVAGGPRGLHAVARQIQKLGQEGHFSDRGAYVGLSVALSRMIAQVRTMSAHATRLLGSVDAPPAKSDAVLTALMNVCSASSPQQKLDKLRTEVMAAAKDGKRQMARIDRLDSELLSQVSQYPEGVWISVEAKSSVQAALRQSLAHHYRNTGALGITGKLNRDAFAPATGG